MLYSVELPFHLKMVYYGKTDKKIDIVDFAEMVKTGKIYIEPDYRSIFTKENLIVTDGIPQAVLRYLMFSDKVDEEKILAQLISNAFHVSLNKDDPQDIVVIEGVKIRRSMLSKYYDYCLYDAINGHAELERFRYNSHLH